MYNYIYKTVQTLAVISSMSLILCTNVFWLFSSAVNNHRKVKKKIQKKNLPNQTEIIQTCVVYLPIIIRNPRPSFFSMLYVFLTTCACKLNRFGKKSSFTQSLYHEINDLSTRNDLNRHRSLSKENKRKLSRANVRRRTQELIESSLDKRWRKSLSTVWESSMSMWTWQSSKAYDSSATMKYFKVWWKFYVVLMFSLTLCASAKCRLTLDADYSTFATSWAPWWWAPGKACADCRGSQEQRRLRDLRSGPPECKALLR